MEKNHRGLTVILLLGVLCLVMFMTGCEEDAKIKSSWRDREIHVDGNDKEWQGCSEYYDEDTRTSVSLLNDENYLFIRVSSHDREIQRQILVQGLTLWLEQKGEKERKIGVHFPVGITREERMQMFQNPSKERQDPFRALLEKGQREIQLLGPGEYEQKTMPISEIQNYDIDVKVGKTEKNLVYELKMPITQNKENRHAFPRPDKEGFRLGLQTGDQGKRVPGNMGNQTPDGAESSEYRRKGGGKPGKMEGESSGGKAGRPEAGKIEPLKIWLAATLAEKI